MSSIDIPVNNVVIMVTDRGNTNWLLDSNGSYLPLGSDEVAIHTTSFAWREAFTRTQQMIAHVDAKQLHSLGFKDQDGVWVIAFEKESGKMLQGFNVVRHDRIERGNAEADALIKQHGCIQHRIQY